MRTSEINIILNLNFIISRFILLHVKLADETASCGILVYAFHNWTRQKQTKTDTLTHPTFTLRFLTTAVSMFVLHSGAFLFVSL